MRIPRDRGETAAVMGVVGLLAATGFALVATAVARRKTSHIDRALRPKLKLRKGHPVRSAADALAPAGKWHVVVPVSVALATWVVANGSRRRYSGAPRAGAASIVASAAIAAGLARVFDDVLPQPPSPPGHRARRKPVFPSGHAFVPGALAFTSAWVLVREGWARPGTAMASALAVPFLSAGGKMLEEKHWGSDVLGGLLAATSVSAVCLAGYELARDAARS